MCLLKRVGTTFVGSTIFVNDFTQEQLANYSTTCQIIGKYIFFPVKQGFPGQVPWPVLLRPYFKDLRQTATLTL